MKDDEMRHGNVGIESLRGTQPPRLSVEEIKALRNGEQVIVTWRGGNGPHEYTIRNDLPRWELRQSANISTEMLLELPAWDYVSRPEAAKESP